MSPPTSALTKARQAAAALALISFAVTFALAMVGDELCADRAAVASYVFLIATVALALLEGRTAHQIGFRAVRRR